MIIDIHCHAGPGDGLTGPWDTRADIVPHLRRARAAGIAKTVVFPAFHRNYRVANAGVAEIVAGHPDELIGFCMVHCRRDIGRVGAMVGRAVREWGFRGIKVHGADAMPTREVCEAAHAYRVPILVDVIGRSYAIEMFAPEYPEVNFIIPHLGSFADDWRAQVQVAEQVARFPNVYTDTSGVRRFEYIEQAIRRAGPTKVCFGSDGPWLHPGAERCKLDILFEEMRLPEPARRQILGGTAAFLLGMGNKPKDACRNPENCREKTPVYGQLRSGTRPRPTGRMARSFA